MTKEKDPQTALFTALAKAQHDARGVEKDAKNSFHRYRYVSAEHMISEAKDTLSGHGLALLPVAADVQLITDARSGASDDEWSKVARAAAILQAKWVVVHVDGGSHAVECSWPVVPEKGRPFDKAVAAARTASLSYLLRDLLQIPRVEEGTEMDSDERDQHRQQAQPRGPRPYTAEQKTKIRQLLDELGLQGDARSERLMRATDNKEIETYEQADNVIGVLIAEVAHVKRTTSKGGQQAAPASR